MTFSVEKQKEIEGDFVPEIYTCYTYGDNDLIENQYYMVKIKEFNWKIKFVEELVNWNDNTAKLPNITLSPVFLAIEFILARNRNF